MPPVSVRLLMSLCLLLPATYLAGRESREVTTGVQPDSRLLAEDGSADDAFGSAIGLSGTRALVGAPRGDGQVGDSGAAYIFEYNGATWVQMAKLVASDGNQNDDFGLAVSVDGDRAVIGAPNSDESGIDSGSAYVFAFDGSNWTQIQELAGPDAVLSDRFGLAVDLLGDRIVVGAPTHGANAAGAAYVFDFDGSSWNFTQKLTPSTPPLASKSAAQKGITAPNFGASVSLGPDRVLIGAPEEDVGKGAAYVFDAVAGNWGLTEQIVLGNADSEEHFGAAVSLFGDRVLIGMPDAFGSRGTAWVYDFDGHSWIARDELSAGDSTEFGSGDCGDRLGGAVSLWGDYALVGAATDDVWGQFAGSSYLFQFYDGNWRQVRKITEDGGAENHNFGQAMAFDNGLAVIGAPGRDPIAIQQPCFTPLLGQTGGAHSLRLVPDPALGLQPDEFEQDNSPATAGVIQVGMQFDVDEFPQRHNLHLGDDEDWVRFVYRPGGSYTITARPRDATLTLGLRLEDGTGTEIDSDGCGQFATPGDELFVFPNSVATTQLLFVRVFECVPDSATGTRDYDLLINGDGHQQCVLLEGTVTDRVTGEAVPLLWIFSDINNTAISGPDGRYRMCTDYDVRELTTLDASGTTLPATVDVISGVTCPTDCIDEDYQDDDGLDRPRIIPGSRALLDFSVSGPVVFRDGFEQL